MDFSLSIVFGREKREFLIKLNPFSILNAVVDKIANLLQFDMNRNAIYRNNKWWIINI